MKTKWVSMQKLAKDLNISRQTVNNWAKRGNIRWKYEENFGMKVVDPESINIKTMSKKEIKHTKNK